MASNSGNDPIHEEVHSVIIVGAGGSLAQAQSLRPSRVKEHPPLDNNFFQKAEKLAESDLNLDRNISKLRSSIEKHGSFPDPFEEVPASLEQYFADVYYEVATIKSNTAFQVFIQLLNLYNDVIGTTTNWIPKSNKLGFLDRIIRKELTREPNDLTLITFNQDLVLEHVVSRLPRIKSTDWCLQQLYGELDITPLVFPSIDGFRFHDDECNHAAPLTLLKLHGSLNWGIRTLRRDPSVSTLFPSKDKEVFLFDAKEVLNRPYIKTSTGRDWYLWPLVVPPIYDKSRVTAMSLLDKIWNRARTKLQNATRLIMIGYSVPDADVSAAQLIRRALAVNENLQCIECLNPDPNIVSKLHDRLDAPIIHLYTSGDKYLSYNTFK